MLKNTLIKNKVYLYLLAFYDGCPLPPSTVLAKQIGITRQTVSKKYKELKDNNFCYIYGIIVNGELEYVGSTNNFELRKKQHILRRPFLKDENFIILKKLSFQDKLDEEKLNIKLYNPEWNTVSKTE